MMGFIRQFSLLIFLIVSNVSTSKITDVSFEESFLPYYQYDPENPLGKQCKELYENYQNNGIITDRYKIPKTIHFIWLGSNLPQQCQEMIDTWKTFHAHWEIKVWTDHDVATFGLQNQTAFDAALNWGEKSDIFRYEILYRYGGIYVDIDFECLQPFDDLHKSCEFYTGFIGGIGHPCLLNGLIGSMPGHPILKACIDNVKVGPGDHHASRIFEDTGPYLFTNMFLDCASEMAKGETVAFPPSFFYPFPATMRDLQDKREIKQRFIRQESMCVHYWSSNWQKNKP